MGSSSLWFAKGVCVHGVLDFELSQVDLRGVHLVHTLEGILLVWLGMPEQRRYRKFNNQSWVIVSGHHCRLSFALSELCAFQSIWLGSASNSLIRSLSSSSATFISPSAKQYLDGDRLPPPLSFLNCLPGCGVWVCFYWYWQISSEITVILHLQQNRSLCTVVPLF